MRTRRATATACGLAMLCSSAAGATEGLPFIVASGWPAVIDVEDVRAVRVAEASLATAVILDRRQVLLVGGAPGQTTLTITVGPAAAAETVVHGLTVTRGQTFSRDAAWVRARVAVPRRVRVPSLARVVTGDSTRCDAVQVGSDELELQPRQAGVAMVLVWTGGESSEHRRELLVDVSSGGVARTVDDDDALVTEPFDGRLALIAGELALVAAPGLTRVAVTDPAVARVSLSGDGSLLVEGLSPGATRALLWTGGARPETRFIVVHPHEAGDAPVQDPLRPAAPEAAARLGGPG